MFILITVRISTSSNRKKNFQHRATKPRVQNAGLLFDSKLQLLVRVYFEKSVRETFFRVSNQSNCLKFHTNWWREKVILLTSSMTTITVSGVFMRLNILRLTRRIFPCFAWISSKSLERLSVLKAWDNGLFRHSFRGKLSLRNVHTRV